MVQRPGVPTAPELVLETATGSTAMSPGRTYHVGRDPLCEICLDDARVSWHHAILRPEGDHWTVEDEHSTNGTWVDGHRVHEWSIGVGSELRFGNASDGPRARCRGPVPNGGPAGSGPASVSTPSLTGTFRRPTTVRPLPTRTAVRIGRAPDSDLVIDDLVVSRRHAELHALTDGTYEIIDLGSHNGTFLNGARVERAPVAEGDIVGIGHTALCLVGDQLQEYLDTGEVSSTSRTSPSPSTAAARPSSTTSPSPSAPNACSPSSAPAEPASPPSSAPSPDCAPPTTAASCTTDATSTATTPNCAAASASSPRTTSCTRSSPSAAPSPTPPNCASRRTPPGPNARPGSTR